MRFAVIIHLLATAAVVESFPQLTKGSQVPGKRDDNTCSFPWTASQLVDITGAHEYRDPVPGQARGPCPAQNALANHGYLDRSGYTTFPDCVAANKKAFNMEADLAGFLCFTAQLTGGDLLGLTWSIGNSSAFDSSIKSSCSSTGILGIIFNIGCSLSKVLDRIFGTPGFGMGQTHNSFESDSSFLRPDWNTINGLDASTPDMSAAHELWKRRLPDGTFDDFNIIIDWASYRKTYGIQNNPCYFRAPQATLAAGLGAYSLVPRMFSNYTLEKPCGTLTGETLAAFSGFKINADGSLQGNGLGKERIPANWYQRPIPYTIAEFLTFDHPRYFERDPSLFSIGGNTNGVNTFTGIDAGDLTGGVINGQNLFDGDNFACFYYRILQIDLENKLPSKVGGKLLELGDTLGKVIDAVFGKMCRAPGGVASCPRFNYADPSTKGNWCAVRQQPKGIY